MISIITNPVERYRFVKFAIVGSIGALVDFGIANLLIHIFNTSLVLAGTISFVCAILSNFTLNRYWTYPDSRSKPVIHQLVMFGIVNLAGLVIRVPILKYLEPLLENFFAVLPFQLPAFSPSVYADNLTLAIAIVIVMFWNYFVNRYWTYSDVKL